MKSDTPKNKIVPNAGNILTKRELIAAMALQGMLAGKYDSNDIDKDVKTSILAADKLMAALKLKHNDLHGNDYEYL